MQIQYSLAALRCHERRHKDELSRKLRAREGATCSHNGVCKKMKAHTLVTIKLTVRSLLPNVCFPYPTKNTKLLLIEVLHLCLSLPACFAVRLHKWRPSLFFKFCLITKYKPKYNFFNHTDMRVFL